MSGTLPLTNRLKSLDPGSVQPCFASQAASGKEWVVTRDAHYWSFELEYIILGLAEARQLFAFLVAQRGRAETFTVVPPRLDTPRGAVGGTPVVHGAGQTGRSVLTSGWPAETTVLLAGDFLKFAGHDKVYMVAEDATSDASGDCELSVEPPLRESPADAEAITVSDVPFTVRLDQDKNSFSLRPADLVPGIKLKLVEALS